MIENVYVTLLDRHKILAYLNLFWQIREWQKHLLTTRFCLSASNRSMNEYIFKQAMKQEPDPSSIEESNDSIVAVIL